MATVGRTRILDLWPDLVDPRTGIIREVNELRIDDDEPPFIHFLSTSSDTAAFGFLPNFGNNGGVGTTARSAIAKALGEGVERYCSAMFSYDDLVFSSYEGLEQEATPPASFALYSPRQLSTPDFPWRSFDDDASVAWTTGRSLVTGRSILVPACYVYVPYHFRGGPLDVPIRQPISTGLACGGSRDEATLSALCEVIERDAFTLTWQGCLARPRVSTGGLPATVLDLLGRYHAVGLRVHLIDISTEVACPVILSVVDGDASTSPAVAVAAAAHPDPVVAARKSLEELAHTRKFSAQVMDYLPPVPVDVEGGHPAVHDQRTHLRFYGPQESRAAAEFLWSSADEVELNDVRMAPGAGLSELVAEVAATGEDVIACDLTTPDVAELGLHVVRVVVPGFHPLHMGHANRCTGGHRLARFPALVGVSEWSPDRDNPYPHPFP